MSRGYNSNKDGNSFDDDTIEAVWKKGKSEPGKTYFRKDKCGASMFRSNYGKTEKWGWEIDHIKPVSEDGSDDLSNLQPLQWENNRRKGDSDDDDWSCKITS